MPVRTLELRSGPIAVHESDGNGPPVLLVHGYSASGRSFRRQLEGPLGRAHRLVALDLPGHGLSPPPGDPEDAYSLPGYARVVVEVVERLGIPDAVLVGWGLGGHVVLEASEALPRSPGLLIFGAPPMGSPPAFFDAFRLHPATTYALEADLSDADVRAFAAAFLRPGTEESSEGFEADIRRTDDRSRQWLSINVTLGRHRDEIGIVAGLSVPLAVLHGAEDPIVNLEYVRALAMPTLWRGDVQVVPGAGHAVQFEQPERFDALLAAFLEEARARS